MFSLCRWVAGSILRTEGSGYEDWAQVSVWIYMQPFCFRRDSGTNERLNTTSNSCFDSDFTHLGRPEPGSPDPKLSSFSFSGHLDFLATVERVSMGPFNPHTTFNYFSCFQPCPSPPLLEIDASNSDNPDVFPGFFIGNVSLFTIGFFLWATWLSFFFYYYNYYLHHHVPQALNVFHVPLLPSPLLLPRLNYFPLTFTDNLPYFSIFAVVHCSGAKLCPTLWDPMDCSMPGFRVFHCLPEFAQTYVNWVSDAIQPFHPLSFPSPPAFSLSQHQCLFPWVNSLHQVARVLELQHQSL